jgi:hypothetical protein
MKHKLGKNFFKKFFYIYLIACFLAGTVGKTLFIRIANQGWVDVAEVYFFENEEIKEQIGAVKKIKCEGRATKADNTGLPVDFIVETEKGIYNITLWMDQNENGSDFVVAHSVTQKA